MEHIKKAGNPSVPVGGALVLAVHEGNGWKYVGGTGRGFNAETLRSVYENLAPLITDERLVPEKVTCVKPKLVAEVKFTEWTTAGEMRHPVFLGLRTDKLATEVIREKPKPLREAKPADSARRR